MPITPIHFGPGMLQHAVVPEITDLRLYATILIAIDAEPIVKGVSGYTPWPIEGPLHGWSHSPQGMLLIAAVCMAAWLALRLCGFWKALLTTLPAMFSAFIFDWFMHGAEMGRPPRPAVLIEEHLQGSIAIGLPMMCGLLACVIYLVKYRWQIVAWLKRELRLS